MVKKPVKSRFLAFRKRLVILDKSEVRLLTIKRRLFWSNVLMLIVPILLGLLLSTIVINLVLSRMGVGDVTHADSNVFYHTIRQSHGSWGEEISAEQILSDLQEWGLPSQSGAVTAALYDETGELATLGAFTGDTLLEMAIAEPEHRHFTMDHASLYSGTAGKYRIYILNTNYEYGQAGYIDDSEADFVLELIILLIIVSVIYSTNRLLTYFVFKSISLPLDTLINGVHEIRDGNLEYRIDYKGKDEFAAVCDDFNEMARQIQGLIEARQRDDENRRELIAGISHDLRTPLTAIVAYAEGLTSGVITESAMQKEYLTTIAEKSKDLTHIVNQLFQFSKLDAGEFPVTMAEVDLGEELKGYVGSVEKGYAQRGLQIIMTDLPEHLFVRIDSVQLRNVFTNLLENSLKYGGREDCIVRISCKTDGSAVNILFADNGPGVPEKQLDKLFTAFYRTDRARRNPEQGSGLGLAISEHIIHRLCGEIHAENSEEGGLCVVITLPVRRGGTEYEEHLDY